MALGRCENVKEERQDECRANALKRYKSSVEECNEQFIARQEVCDDVGTGPYLPQGIKPSTFVSYPIGNDYFPLTPGVTRTYKTVDAKNEIIETVVVRVKRNTRTILGVTCRVVQDTVYEGDVDDGESRKIKIEDTTDWFALQENGDVWYFGEIALNFEDGVITDVDGSWTAGVEGAKPGIVMFADPGKNIGKTYRQEFALGEAEDVATIVAILSKAEFKDKVLKGKTVPLVFGDGPFLHTRDFAALEPGVVEDKYYGKGVGNVLIVKPSGEIEKLVKVEKTP